MVRIFTALSGAQVSWTEREAFFGVNFALIEVRGLKSDQGQVPWLGRRGELGEWGWIDDFSG